MQQFILGGIKVDVTQKDIKNIHLSVYPPDGAVRIAAPQQMDLNTIRVYAVTRLAWIKKQRTKFLNQARETEREMLNRESHYYFGSRYLLKIYEVNEKPKVVLRHQTIDLYVRPNATLEKKKEVLQEWYRKQLKLKAIQLVKEWEKRMGLNIHQIGIKKMKTKWGTCNIEDKRIWLNLELAKKPVKCIEYVIVHEMTHLYERNHNTRFTAIMDKYLPDWRLTRTKLNNLPIGFWEW